MESSYEDDHVAAPWGEETHLEFCYVISAALLLFLLVHMVSDLLHAL